MEVEKIHSCAAERVFDLLQVSRTGLSREEAAARLRIHGPNVFPTKKLASVWQLFFRQFLNPLIYVLLAAAVVSILLGDFADAFFIAVVLLVNAVIGTVQEYGAEQSAQALRRMAASKSMVIRGGETVEIDAEEIVPGDVVLLESGRKVPADLRLFASHSLEVDESLLTGESLPVSKNHMAILGEETPLGDRANMLFTGSLVTKGRAKGVVVATGLKTELGRIAESIITGESAKPPLLIRMEVFTKKIAWFLLVVTLLMGFFLLVKGQPWHEVLMFSVALAVAAIPEGLPVALTVALAIASRRMAKRNVIVRKLPAVEALGSCTYIATDKTGTLTVNQLTIRRIALPGSETISVEGSGLNPSGAILFHGEFQRSGMEALVTAGLLCNEGHLTGKNGEWVGQGDAVDLAFLVLAHKAGLDPEERRSHFRLTEEVPFEPENQYAATLHESASESIVSVKGALEKILPMCADSDREAIVRQADFLADNGYRVLALAGKRDGKTRGVLPGELHDLNFYGLVGMIDPLRPEAAEAIASCRQAGIRVAMVTGDHPKTSLAIARELGLAKEMSEVVSGPMLKEARDDVKSAMIDRARVFARVEPQQKLEIVRHLLAQGKFVAVTGDGANDAPALRAANVGVAMGKDGTDVARETSDLILTDDRFASIVAGIEQGRVAYSNIRKVTYLLISTGAAEILMFTLSMIFNTPLPLTAVQILWLNLVTNGIQDVGLAFEPAEGDELEKPPRKPNEPVFNRVMIERVALSALVMGGVSFWYFNGLIGSGMSLASAQNLTLLLMVLFENVMIGNCRSETKSAFILNPLRNPVLLLGTLGAQGLHILAMYVPGLRDVLGVEPVALAEWARLLGMALSVLAAIEIYKWIRNGIERSRS